MASTRSGSLAPLDSDRPLRPVRGTTRRAMTTPTADEPRDCVEPGMPLLFGAGRWVDDRRSGGQVSVEHRSGDQGPPEECGWCCPRHRPGWSAMLSVRGLTVEVGGTLVVEGAAFTVRAGGERRRVELARILFAGSDLLLLDEPTNHLDNDAREWLFGFLRSYRGALIIISHDLELLDESITRVLHLDRPGEADVGELTEYKGTYSQYRVARARDEERRAKLAARQQAEIARLQTLVDRWGAKASKASFANALETRIARIRNEAVDAPAARRGLRLRLPDPPPSGRTTVEVAGLSKSYGGGPPVFEDVSFDVGRGERLLVLGLNGAGKTSLLRILARTSEADAGVVTFGHQVTVGYYAQEHEGIRARASLFDHMTEAAPGLDNQVRRRLLGTFGLSGDKVFQDAVTLSGGEKTKLALSLLVAGRHNLLLLDEPTNNLDPPSREAVAAALASWAGTMVIVSPDADAPGGDLRAGRRSRVTECRSAPRLG